MSCQSDAFVVNYKRLAERIKKELISKLGKKGMDLSKLKVDVVYDEISFKILIWEN